MHLIRTLILRNGNGRRNMMSRLLNQQTYRRLFVYQSETVRTQRMAQAPRTLPVPTKHLSTLPKQKMNGSLSKMTLLTPAIAKSSQILRQLPTNENKRSNNIGTKTQYHLITALRIFRTTQHVESAGRASNLASNTALSGTRQIRTRSLLYQHQLNSGNRLRPITRYYPRQKLLAKASACL